MSIILVTRPYPQAEKTASFLQQAGYETVISPAISLMQTKDTANNLRHIHAGAHIIISSQKALDIITRHKLDTDVTLYVTGDVLAHLARKCGFDTVICGTGSIRSLMACITENPKNTAHHFTYICGNITTLNVPKYLAAHGISASSVIVYESTPVHSFTPEALHALQHEDINAVLCYSRFSSEAFIAACERQILRYKNLSYCCLSHTIAEYMSMRGCQHVYAATAPTDDKILAALRSCLERSPK